MTTNKASGGDGIPVELFQIPKDDAVKVLHSICQQIWKIQWWPRNWKRSVFIPIPKKGNAKKCSNYCTIALISHASEVMLKIPQARLQQLVVIHRIKGFSIVNEAEADVFLGSLAFSMIQWILAICGLLCFKTNFKILVRYLQRISLVF